MWNDDSDDEEYMENLINYLQRQEDRSRENYIRSQRMPDQLVIQADSKPVSQSGNSVLRNFVKKYMPIFYKNPVSENTSVEQSDSKIRAITPEFRERVKKAIDDDDASIVCEYIKFFNCKNIQVIFYLNDVFTLKDLKIEYGKGKILSEVLRLQKRALYTIDDLRYHILFAKKTISLEFFYENIKLLLNNFNNINSPKKMKDKQILLELLNNYVTDEMLVKDKEIITKINNYLLGKPDKPSLTDRLNTLN